MFHSGEIFDPPVSTVSLVSIVAPIVAKIKKHVSPAGIVLSYSSIAMPKLPGEESVNPMVLFITRSDQPAVIGVRMPAVPMFHTIQRMATVVVRIGGGGG